MRFLFLIFAFFCSAPNIAYSYCKNDILKSLVILPNIEQNKNLGYMEYTGGTIETSGETMVMSIIEEDSIVFDVGAHTGEWSLNALKTQPNINLFAFEPIPILAEALRTNLKNKPVSIHQLVLSNINDFLSFCYYPKNPGLSTLHPRLSVETQLNLTKDTLLVEAVTIDSFCNQNNISHIDFIKIDTEGNELNVLLGAQNLLENASINAIQFEYGGCYKDSNTTLQSVFEYLTDLEYSIYRISQIGLIDIPIWEPELENYLWCNYLAIRN